MSLSIDRDRPSDAARRPVLCGEEVPKTGHICAFFDSSTEKYEVLARYFNDAIRSGDRVINVVEERKRSDHVRGLTEAGVDLASAQKGGRFRLATCEETYFRDDRPDLDAVLDMLRDELQTAREQGSCVRTCGEMDWVARDPSLRERAMEYEARVNEIVPTFDCTMLCVYDIAQTPAPLITDILATHPYAIIRGRLRANPWAVHPSTYIEMLRSPHAARPELGPRHPSA